MISCDWPQVLTANLFTHTAEKTEPQREQPVRGKVDRCSGFRSQCHEVSRDEASRQSGTPPPPPPTRLVDGPPCLVYLLCLHIGWGRRGRGVWSHVRIKLAVAVSWHSLILSMQNSIAKKHGLIHVCKRKDISIEHSQAKI